MGWIAVSNYPKLAAKGIEMADCGTGAGGFKPGNTCAAGDGTTPDEIVRAREKTRRTVEAHQEEIAKLEKHTKEISEHPTASAKDKQEAINHLKSHIEDKQDRIRAAKDALDRFEAGHGERQQVRAENEKTWNEAQEVWKSGKTLYVATMTRITNLAPKNQGAMRLFNGEIQIRQGKSWNTLVGQALDSFKNSIERAKNSGHLKLNMSTSAIIFAHDNESPDFKPALTLGQGYPKDIEGQPVAHFWKEVLRPRRFVDAAGTAHTVDPARIDLLLSNFGKLKAKGKLPTLPSHHPQGPQDALNNLGHVVDAKKNDAGGLEVLCQFVGIDAIRASARNAASIGTVVGFTDAEGIEYGEILDHVAIVPDPRLTDLQGFKFQPALAASSGPAIPAVVLTPAAAPPQRSKIMDVTKLRKALNLAEDIPAETVIVKAEEKITADATALATATQTAKDEKARADAADAKALTLSNSAPRNVDPEILNDRLGTFSDKVDYLMERYKGITPEHKTAALELVAPGGKPSALMLSQSIATGPAQAVLKLLELSATNPFGQQTNVQPVPRSVPGENPPKPVTPERKAELLAHAPG